MRNFKQKIHELRLQDAIRFVWRSGPIWTIASIALTILQAASPLIMLYLTKLILDTVTAGLASGDASAAFQQVSIYVVLITITALATLVIRLASNLVYDIQSSLVTDYMLTIIHNKAVEVDLEYYETPEYYDTLHRAQEEATHRPTDIVNSLTVAAQNGVSLIAIIGLLVSFHWAIALFLFLAALPGIAARLWYSNKLYHWERRQSAIQRKSSYFNFMLTGYDHAKENRLFGLGNLFAARAADLRATIRGERIRMGAKFYLIEFVTQASSTLAVFLSYAFIINQTLSGNITIGDLVMYYQAFQRGQEFLRNALGGLADLYQHNLFLSNLFEFLELKPKVIEPAQPAFFPRPISQGIVFQNVSFRYAASDRKALKNINLSIGPGEVVALVGENGSGKTTLVKLLCRLYDPVSGCITIDGIPLTNFSISDLRHEIGVVFQDYMHYYLTARENIWFGNSSLNPDTEKVYQAAQESGADEVITALSSGYDTILGKVFENGEELSIGQWQKIALARAYMRDSQVIVLDEPTSAMDARAEHEVFLKFRELAKGRAAVLISHRLSTVKMADKIYFLEHGRIKESGTHQELIALQGTYAQMFETQARNYR